MSTKKMTLELLFFGEEPHRTNPEKQWDLNKALSWYSNQFSTKESKAYALEYVKKNKYPKDIIQKLSSTKEKLFTNLGFVCRIVSRGYVLDRPNWIDDKINSILSANQIEDSSEEPEKKRNVQDRIQEQGTQYINKIEDIVEEIIKTKKIPVFDCYEFLKINDIKPIYAKQIINHYSSLHVELKQTLNKEDEQLIEGYSLWTKKALKEYFTFIDNIIKACNDYSNNTKTVRKVQKKKSVAVEKKISKLNYKKEDNEYKIVSIDPISIFSGNQLWVFNVKTRKLGLYQAKDDSGLSIKGSTIENFTENSIQKTLRKPAEILPIVTKGKKTELKKLMGGINSKEDVLTGRINSDTILLKVLK